MRYHNSFPNLFFPNLVFPRRSFYTLWIKVTQIIEFILCYDFFYRMNNTYILRITREFTFEMAHALYGYDGPCRNIHGHSYRLSVTVMGKVNRVQDHPKNGMVMDFSDLKKIVTTEIIDKLDHGLMLHKEHPLRTSAENNPLFGKLIFVDYQPTCENVLADMAQRIALCLPDGVALHHLCLRETAASYAEWHAGDQDAL